MCQCLEYFSSILLKLWKWMKYFYTYLLPLAAAAAACPAGVSDIFWANEFIENCSSRLPRLRLQWHALNSGSYSNPLCWCESNRCTECYLQLPGLTHPPWPTSHSFACPSFGYGSDADSDIRFSYKFAVANFAFSFSEMKKTVKKSGKHQLANSRLIVLIAFHFISLPHCGYFVAVSFRYGQFLLLGLHYTFQPLLPVCQTPAVVKVVQVCCSLAHKLDTKNGYCTRLPGATWRCIWQAVTNCIGEVSRVFPPFSPWLHWECVCYAHTRMPAPQFDLSQYFSHFAHQSQPLQVQVQFQI